jgi:CTP:molybdopterin cytidylyltransferase MocA
LALGAKRALDLDAEKILVCLADMPLVTAAHLRLLLAAEGNVVATEAVGIHQHSLRVLTLPALTTRTASRKHAA